MHSETAYSHGHPISSYVEPGGDAFLWRKELRETSVVVSGAPPKPCMQVCCPEGLEEPKYRCKAVENEDGDNWDYLA